MKVDDFLKDLEKITDDFKKTVIKPRPFFVDEKFLKNENFKEIEHLLPKGYVVIKNG